MDVAQPIAISSLVATLGSLLVYFVKFNHKRIRSKCCDKSCITSLDVEETTPPNLEVPAAPPVVESKPELRITIPQL
jgi:hypothetical protein